MQGDGDVGETVEMPDGRELRRLHEPHRRTYRSIFGPFTLSRYVYGTREGQRIDFVPLDARLELPESEYSYVLQDWAGTLWVEHAFARTAQTLETILGLSASGRQSGADEPQDGRVGRRFSRLAEEAARQGRRRDSRGHRRRQGGSHATSGRSATGRRASQEGREGEQEADGHDRLRLHGRSETSYAGRRGRGSFSRTSRRAAGRIGRAGGPAQTCLVELDLRRRAIFTSTRRPRCSPGWRKRSDCAATRRSADGLPDGRTAQLVDFVRDAPAGRQGGNRGPAARDQLFVGRRLPVPRRRKRRGVGLRARPHVAHPSRRGGLRDRRPASDGDQTQACPRRSERN